MSLRSSAGIRYDLGASRSWDKEREQGRRHDRRDRGCAGFRRRSSAGRSIRRWTWSVVFGLIGGDIFHGKMSLDQLFSACPMIGAADYRMPLPGLYLCGSGAHPGGE